MYFIQALHGSHLRRLPQFEKSRQSNFPVDLGHCWDALISFGVLGFLICLSSTVFGSRVKELRTTSASVWGSSGYCQERYCSFHLSLESWSLPVGASACQRQVEARKISFLTLRCWALTVRELSSLDKLGDTTFVSKGGSLHLPWTGRMPTSTLQQKEAPLL